MFEKLVSFTKKVADLADRPALNPSDLKAHFDAAPDEVRQSLNKLIDALKKTEKGDSGAKNIGASQVEGLAGTDVQTVLESIYAARKNIPLCRAHQKTAQSVPNNVYNLNPLLDDKDVDTNNMYGQYSFTCQKRGYYLIQGGLSFQANTTGVRKVGILLNGTQIKSNTVAAVPASSIEVETSIIYPLSVGDKVFMFAYQNSGGALSLNPSNDTYLSMIMLIEI